ncbi:hypothetical protein PVAND_003102 [Polypedilum vanderplanki]|uniref:HTH CENPB-type domain-containing protein n=1 Tax=Polypedilum vanderplanki TaxID=319348 RepID=A0A9J6BTI7_POLVA|nr:hypothetical protein PVAND_003102 [Polypedilum vanderplanki]
METAKRRKRRKLRMSPSHCDPLRCSLFRLIELTWVRLTKGDPRTKEDLKIAATDYDKYENDPPKFGPKGPSIKWLNGFLKRHPSVSVRTPENLGKASATVTQDDINRFFSKFYSYMVENGFEDVLSRPDALFNLDETSFDLNQVPRKV